MRGVYHVELPVLSIRRRTQDFQTPHPSPLFVNHAPGNRERLISELIRVRDILQAKDS
jgi:hypothetical protein